MATAEGNAASIGKSVQIHGEVKGSEDLIVDGTIEGTITMSESKLTIGPNAHVKANVAARDVILLGVLVGDISASGRVELRAGSNLKGDIRAGRLSIEENAMLSGKVDLAGNERASAASSPSAPAPAGALFGTT
jgi:cytoskeletal protein CcmA (bactofilin family)